ncbi:MAG: heavy-metal-associated domain-containing protein [Flavobacteriales bacterium]|jgi:copper chaperone CopZ|nr:heavy-metal-associated domain-containing protein [Flavobacteriales bacterium]MDP2160504.1 heavy-metal-associated domain-containing protein [Flavobacterium sp.]
MKFFNKTITMLSIALMMLTSCDAQVNNAKTDTVKIYGNCGMCKKTIEKAGNLENIAKVNWNKDTKMATISYDSSKTTLDEILQRIANVGYDSDAFTTPDEVYNNLHGCCQYERPKRNNNQK